MFGQFYAGMRWTALPLGALILFLVTFLVVLSRALFFAKREEIDELSRLPLDDGGAGREGGAR